MPSSQRANPGIFEGNRGHGANIKVLKSAFFFQYSTPFGYYKNVISKQGEITQNLCMFCKYLMADRRSLFSFKIAHSGFYSFAVDPNSSINFSVWINLSTSLLLQIPSKRGYSTRLKLFHL